MISKHQDVPVIGKYYYFFDDGKTNPSRCYKAKVVRIIPYGECDLEYEIYDYYCKCKIPKTLKDIHKEEVDDHRQSENFTVLNSGDTTPGKPWLYSEETDFFVECEIPGYDENTIWFVRTVQGGWFSIDVQSSWQHGSLDVDGSIYKEIKEEYHNGWYDEQLKAKGELI